MTQEALKLALEALENHTAIKHPQQIHYRDKAITAIKEALAQHDSEPDWKGLVLAHNAECERRCDKERCGYARYFENNGRRCPTCPVYEKIDIDTTPPQRTWVVFPTMLRKMWSGSEVQAWLDENVNKEMNNG